MSDDPDPLIDRFGFLKFANQETEDTGVVGIREVVVVENVGSVPEVRVYADYTEALGCGCGVCSVARERRKEF